MHYLEYTIPAVGTYCKIRPLWSAAAVFVINGGAIIGSWGVGVWRRGIEKFLTKDRGYELSHPLHRTWHRSSRARYALLSGSQAFDGWAWTSCQYGGCEPSYPHFKESWRRGDKSCAPLRRSNHGRILCFSP